MGQSTAKSAGINQLTDQVIASDLLFDAKAGVKMYAEAMTASATPAVRNMLKKQLEQAMTFQEQAAAYMADRGWYNMNDLDEQLKKDMKKAQETLEMLK